MKMTKDQFDRACREFKKHAKADKIEVTLYSGYFLIECSEVEMYRLAEAYNFDKKNNSWGYSENMKTHYFMFYLNYDGIYEDEGK